jgi:hypothetical protein
MDARISRFLSNVAAPVMGTSSTFKVHTSFLALPVAREDPRTIT